MEKRFSYNYSFRADYTFQVAEGTYSNPADAYNAISQNQDPALVLQPMNWDQTHTLNVQLIYMLSDWTFSLIGRYWSGQPYTPSFARGEVVTEVSGLARNSARLPDQKTIDLTGDLRFEVFLNVYNLLDQRDQTSVYADTGSADYTTGNGDPSLVPYNPNRVGTPEEHLIQPTRYTGPRQMQLGVTLGF